MFFKNAPVDQYSLLVRSVLLVPDDPVARQNLKDDHGQRCADDRQLQRYIPESRLEEILRPGDVGNVHFEVFILHVPSLHQGVGPHLHDALRCST